MTPNDIKRTTGLSERQQAERKEQEHRWIARVLHLLTIANCTAVQALRAVEDADLQQNRRRQS
jgi:hypothetical protein